MGPVAYRGDIGDKKFQICHQHTACYFVSNIDVNSDILVKPHLVFLRIVMIKNRNNFDFNDIRLFIVKMNIIQNQVYKNFKFSRIQAI